MTQNGLIDPHGGKLVNLLVDSERSALLKDIALNLPDITLNERQLCHFELLATGAFSPLQGFMKRIDYESVLDRMRLQSGDLWPLPICLDVPELTVDLEGASTPDRVVPHCRPVDQSVDPVDVQLPHLRAGVLGLQTDAEAKGTVDRTGRGLTHVLVVVRASVDLPADGDALGSQPDLHKERTQHVEREVTRSKGGVRVVSRTPGLVGHP